LPEYRSPDYTWVIKQFDPVPLRQTQPFEHNKKHSAQLWVVFLLREHFHSLGLAKLAIDPSLRRSTRQPVFSVRTVRPIFPTS
jgi:hypothetical protein